jgi:hypothetical protein
MKFQRGSENPEVKAKNPKEDPIPFFRPYLTLDYKELSPCRSFLKVNMLSLSIYNDGL